MPPAGRVRGVYAVTDDALLARDPGLRSVAAALGAGAALLQYRGKTGGAARRRELAGRLLALCGRFGTPLVINDDIELCRETGAAGVHLGRTDPDPALARARLGPDAVVGVTCHDSVGLALDAERAGACYAAFGRFFPSRTRPDAPSAPVEVLARAKRALSIPVVAIGGIDAENGAALVRAGADALAAVRGIFGAADPAGAVRRLAALFDAARGAPEGRTEAGGGRPAAGGGRPAERRQA